MPQASVDILGKVVLPGEVTIATPRMPYNVWEKITGLDFAIVHWAEGVQFGWSESASGAPATSAEPHVLDILETTPFQRSTGRRFASQSSALLFDPSCHSIPFTSNFSMRGKTRRDKKKITFGQKTAYTFLSPTNLLRLERQPSSAPYTPRFVSRKPQSPQSRQSCDFRELYGSTESKTVAKG